ncbi:putative transmembrane protein 244 [Ptychodera flava]|uniref:putative transmembrane protein 244 n=1 Tax=Ptychodera flava TaxID=63121 RepID=UPI003969F832
MTISTGRIFLNILVCLFSFYAVFYISSTIVFGAFSLKTFDGTTPFHYESFDDVFYHLVPFNQTVWTSQPFLSDFIALEATYIFTTWIYLIFLDSWLWDYAITVTIIHCAIVCAVNLTFPLIWEWWVCVLIGLTLMIILGESINACCNCRKKGKFTPEKETKPT